MVKLFSSLLMLVMVFSVYMIVMSISERKFKKAIIWAIIFLLPIAFLVAVYLNYT